MSQKVLNSLLVIVIIAVIGMVVYFNVYKKPTVANNTVTAVATTTQNDTTASSTIYKNTDYGFTFTLPKSWEGYSIIEDEWQGDSIDAKGNVQTGTVNGPLITIRHPDWDYKAPRQDIPIMVFTIQQWTDMQADKFHIGAAPIGPSEIGQNSKYVFAIPARYNFSYLVGYEEVDQIIRGDNFKAF